jgi:oxygen-dependent protoporphyrinogen oxidase
VLQVHTADSPPAAHSLVVSALPPSALSPISPLLATIPSLDVGVVGLYYRDPSLLRYNGFGYLVPRVLAHGRRAADGAPAPGRGDVLGVLFDSAVAPALDGAGGTKLTVLLGGAAWAGRRADGLPDEAGLARLAREAVREQLGVGARPDAACARLLRGCIPQLPVGHAELLAEAVGAVEEEFGGRVSLTGTGVHWPSVPRCFAGAWRQACWVARHVDKATAS